jgi:hypothetical protein
LIAAEKAWELYRRKIPCRIMRCVLGTGKGAGTPHFLLVYRVPSGEFFTYDGDGSRCLGKVRSHVIDIAAAYDPLATKPKWFTEMSEEFVEEQRAMEGDTRRESGRAVGHPGEHGARMGWRIEDISDPALRRRLIEASASNRPLAPRLLDAITQPRAERKPTRAHRSKDGSSPRVVFRIVRRACRLVDADNLGGAKFLIDAIRRSGLIPDDDPRSIKLELEQEEVETRAEQGVKVEIVTAA